MSTTRKNSDEQLVEVATKLIRQGMSQEKVVDSMTKSSGRSRTEIKRLVAQVWEESRVTRRTNALILVGVGAVLIAIGVAIGVGEVASYVIAAVPFAVGVLLGLSGLNRLREIYARPNS